MVKMCEASYFGKFCPDFYLFKMQKSNHYQVWMPELPVLIYPVT